jgi:hypothetical protein
VTIRRSLAALAIVLLILLAGVAFLYATGTQMPPATVVSSATPTPTATVTAAPVTTAPSTTNPPSATTASPATATPQAGGAITGRFAYGSDFIPPVIVYAISTTDARVWYSVPFAGFGNPPRPTLPPGQTQATYTIAGVAPGTYWVVAYRTDGQLPDPGYYSRQAECQRTTPSGPCPDINPAVVTVVSGQTASGIDIVTWGTQPQPSPTLPPRPAPR